MLGKLLKYEFRAVGRILLPVYGVYLVSYIIFNYVMFESDAFSLTAKTTSTVFFAMMVTTVSVVTLVLIIQRFYKNLLGDEGYLMFTLPVSTGAHIFNKILCGSAMICFGLVVATISIGIFIGTDSGFIYLFNAIGDGLGKAVEEIGLFHVLVLILETIVLAVGLCAVIVSKIYAAIAIGHMWTKHRVLGAVGAYIGMSIVESICTDLLIELGEVSWIKDIFKGYYSMSGTAQTETGMLLLIIMVLIPVAIYWFISYKVLDKRLNLQ